MAKNSFYWQIATGVVVILGVLGLMFFSPEYKQPEIAPTPIPTPLPTMALPTQSPSSEFINIRYSHYWPPLGGVNCFSFYDGWCKSKMSSGEMWEHWIGRAVACPDIFPFGTIFKLHDQEWVCLDRGGKIVVEEGIPWIDFLTFVPRHSYGDVVRVEIIRP